MQIYYFTTLSNVTARNSNKVRLLISYRINFVTHRYFYHQRKIILPKVLLEKNGNYQTMLKGGWVKVQTISGFVL